MDNVAAACEFARVPPGPAARIADERSRQNVAVNEPRRDDGAFLPDGPVDDQIEGPRVFGIERTMERILHLASHRLPDARNADL